MNNPKSLINLPTEMILTIMKKLPSFDDLVSLINTHPRLLYIFEENQYSICGSIALSEFGELWVIVRRILVLHANLIREACIELDIRKLFLTAEEKPYSEETGLGVLEGGYLIGEVEAIQLMAYKKHLDAQLSRFLSVNNYFRKGCRCDENGDSDDTNRPSYLNEELWSVTLPIQDPSPTPEQRRRLVQALWCYSLLLLICVPRTKDQFASCRYRKCGCWSPYSTYPWCLGFFLAESVGFEKFVQGISWDGLDGSLENLLMLMGYMAVNICVDGTTLKGLLGGHEDVVSHYKVLFKAERENAVLLHAQELLYLSSSSRHYWEEVDMGSRFAFLCYHVCYSNE